MTDLCYTISGNQTKREVIILLKIVVEKENETINVLLLKHKNTSFYSYINITKGHICQCVFSSIEEALEDIEDRKRKKLLVDYHIVETFDRIF